MMGVGCGEIVVPAKAGTQRRTAQDTGSRVSRYALARDDVIVVVPVQVACGTLKLVAPAHLGN